MNKKVILWLILMLVAVYIVWVVIINVQDSKPNYEKIVNKDGQTIYRIENEDYKIVDESDNVMIETNKGLMIISLYEDYAPITVANFKKLVKEKFYDGLTFHRVIKDFMIQTGDPTATGTGGSKDTIKGEFEENGVKNNLSHKRGTVSMARQGGNPETEQTYNSASSQFFIVQKDSTYLDKKYAAFGLLIKGYSTLDKIAEVNTDENDKPLEDVVIKQIRFVSVVEE